jgi:hypothetical protein
MARALAPWGSDLWTAPAAYHVGLGSRLPPWSIPRARMIFDQRSRKREPPLHEADEDVRLLCPSALSLGTGPNENTNGLLPQFFPKGTRFNQLSRREIKRVQAMFNDRPRKVLNWHSPAHTFHHLLH